MEINSVTRCLCCVYLRITNIIHLKDLAHISTVVAFAKGILMMMTNLRTRLQLAFFFFFKYSSPIKPNLNYICIAIDRC